MDGPERGGPELYSVRSLLATQSRGGVRIIDLAFSARPLRVCCFRARTGPPILRRSRYLDARNARLSGDSFVVQDASAAQLPSNAFEFSKEGWVYGKDEVRLGDVLDILIDDRLRIIEFTTQLRHRLLLSDETLSLLTKEEQRHYMRTVPDATAVAGDSYTLAQLPAPNVMRVKVEELIYEVHSDFPVGRLTDTILEALRSGRKEKGLIRNLFYEVLSSR